MDNIGDIIGLLVIVGVVALKAIGNAISNQQQRERESGSKAAESSEGNGDGGFSWEDWGWEPAATTSTTPAPKREKPSTAKAKVKVSSPPDSGYSEPASRESVASCQKLESDEGYSWDAPEAPEGPNHQDAHQHQQAYQTWDESRAQQSPGGVEARDVSSTSIADESFQYAFPEAMRKVRRLKRGTRAPIVLKVNGRKDLRRAILLREVLMSPRAYDI